MLKKTILSLLYVCCVTAASKFIGDAKKRPEFFELTDNEVAVFRVTLPPEEYEQLKEECNRGMPPPPPNFNFTDMPQNGTDGEQMMWPPPPQGDWGEGGFPPPPPGNWEEGGMPPPPPFGGDEDSFKTKNGTLVVELNNEEKSFKKITFSLGGSSSRTFARQGFNLKIRGKDELYGRTQFRIRPDAREATLLRSKLVCDIHNRIGIPSISANYIQLYINDEFLGLYVIMDSVKLSWVEFEYGEKDTTHLYKCKNLINTLTVNSSATGCENENEEFTDNTEWVEFLTRLDAAESPEDIEDIFDIDQFLTEIALEYLFGSWDHFLHFGHNFMLFKPENDKWKMIEYDFDGELGQDSFMGVIASPGRNRSNIDMSAIKMELESYSFAEWADEKRHLLDILIFKDTTRFDNILKNIIKEVFNPTLLFPHIDELKDFIRPYVLLDKTPDENGNYPGRINTNSSGDYTMAQWEANSEFTTVETSPGGGPSSIGYGLKYWILGKYRYVCKAYDIECDETYLDENYEYTIDKEVEAIMDPTKSMPPGPPPGFGGQGQGQGQFPPPQGQGQGQFGQFPPPQGQGQGQFGQFPPPQGQGQGQGQGQFPPPQGEGQGQGQGQFGQFPPPQATTSAAAQPTETIVNEPTVVEPEPEPTNTENEPIETLIAEPTEPAVEVEVSCYSELLGYPCCPPSITHVYDHDDVSGDWGYDFETKQWCGLTLFGEPIEAEDSASDSEDEYQCMGELDGYECCPPTVTEVIDHNVYGDWGFNRETKQWCSLTPYEPPVDNDEECWSKALGYSCCKGCKVYSTDDKGEWGINYAKNEWCGIRASCKAN